MDSRLKDFDDFLCVASPVWFHERVAFSPEVNQGCLKCESCPLSRGPTISQIVHSAIDLQRIVYLGRDQGLAPLG